MTDVGAVGLAKTLLDEAFEDAPLRRRRGKALRRLIGGVSAWPKCSGNCTFQLNSDIGKHLPDQLREVSKGFLNEV